MPYIFRDIDDLIERNITDKKGTVFLVSGEGGIGKTTLLKKFFDYELELVPTILIDIKEDFNHTKTFSNILLDRDTSIMKNCENVEEIRSIIDENPQFFASVLEEYSEEISKVSNNLDGNYGSLVKTAIDGIKLITKFSKRDYEAKKREILNNIEYSLVTALQKDFNNYGIFMIDTYEKVKNINILSQIDFKNKSIYKKSLGEKSYRLSHYLKGLINLLGDKTTFVIASRSYNDEFMDLPHTKRIDIKNFSKSNIKFFFKYYQNDIGMPNEVQLNQIEQLTNGNPLMISFFPKIVQEYKSWDKLDYEEMKRRVSEENLLSYLVNRLLGVEGVENDLKDNVWKLIIPRVLTDKIIKLLFTRNDIIKIFIDLRLIYKGIAKASNKYYLHDNVYRAIVNDLQNKYKDIFYSYHDSDEVRELHLELINYYDSCVNLKNQDFELCYHKIMLSKEFEKKFEVTRDEFSEFLLGSFSLKYYKKILNCNNFNSFSDYNIIKMIDTFQYEKQVLLPEIGEELYSEFVDYSSKGENRNGIYDIDYLKGLLEKNKYRKDWILYLIMGNTYLFKDDRVKALEFYNKALDMSPNKDIVYFKIGLIFYEQKNYLTSVKLYKEAIRINPKSYKYYVNLAINYDALGQYDLAIEAYIKAENLNPNREKVFFNMALTYLHLEKYDLAIKAYQNTIKINSFNFEAFMGLGKIFYIKEMYKEASDAYKKAADIDSQSYDAYICLAECYSKLKKPDKASKAHNVAVINKHNKSSDYLSHLSIDCLK